MQHITGKMSFAQVYEMTKEKGLSNVGIEENDIDDEELGISDFTRAEIFSKCYSRDGKNAEVKKPIATRCTDGGLNDIYSQVLGKDKGGRVRMYGYGVTTNPYMVVIHLARMISITLPWKKKDWKKSLKRRTS
ncbi:hypothetical protein ACS0TY_027310 [Phlomoides rotata]